MSSTKTLHYDDRTVTRTESENRLVSTLYPKDLNVIVSRTFIRAKDAPLDETDLTVKYRSAAFDYTFQEKADGFSCGNEPNVLRRIKLHSKQLSGLCDLLQRELPGQTVGSARAAWQQETKNLRSKIVGDWLPQLSDIGTAVNGY